MLQACKAALENPEDQVDIDMIYECIGAPHPQDIEAVLDLVLKDDWTTCILTFDRYKKSKGLALVDLVLGFVEILSKYDLKPATRVKILKGLSDIEYGISKGGNDKIQTSAVVAVIKSAMESQA